MKFYKLHESTNFKTFMEELNPGTIVNLEEPKITDEKLLKLQAKTAKEQAEAAEAQARANRFNATQARKAGSATVTNKINNQQNTAGANNQVGSTNGIVGPAKTVNPIAGASGHVTPGAYF